MPKRRARFIAELLVWALVALGTAVILTVASDRLIAGQLLSPHPRGPGETAGRLPLLGAAW